MSLPQVTVEHPCIPEILHGDPFENVEDWLDQYKHVTMVICWNKPLKLAHAYFALENSTRT